MVSKNHPVNSHCPQMYYSDVHQSQTERQTNVLLFNRDVQQNRSTRQVATSNRSLSS